MSLEKVGQPPVLYSWMLLLGRVGFPGSDHTDGCSWLRLSGWKPWDYCAGMVIVTESGGVISTLRGEDFSIYSKSMVCAANEVLARKLIGSIASSLR